MKELKAPTWLGVLGQAKWLDLIKQLPAISEREADTLALLCMSWQNYLTAQACITELGQVIPAKGSYRANPACNVANETWKQIIKLSTAFGLTPDMEAVEQAVSPLKRLIENRG